MNNINYINRPRKIDYYVDLLSDEIPERIYEGSNYEAFKLKIKERHMLTDIGEINFMIRDKSNNLKYILVYCMMTQPNQIFKIDYYINDIVPMPNKNRVKIDEILDKEKAEMFVKDLVHNYISKNYNIISFL